MKQVGRIEVPQGAFLAVLAAAFDDPEGPPVAVAGFRVARMLAWGCYLIRR